MQLTAVYVGYLGGEYGNGPQRESAEVEVQHTFIFCSAFAN